MPTFERWNYPKLSRRLRDIGPNLEAEVHLRARRASILFKQAAQGVVSGPRSGRYYLKRDGSRYRASAPGEPPTVKSGYLYDSFEVEFTFTPGIETWEGGRSADIEIVLKNDRPAEGGGPLINYLEFGTWKMAPRPSRARIIRRAWPLVQAEFNRRYLPGIVGR